MAAMENTTSTAHNSVPVVPQLPLNTLPHLRPGTSSQSERNGKDFTKVAYSSARPPLPTGLQSERSRGASRDSDPFTPKWSSLEASRASTARSGSRTRITPRAAGASTNRSIKSSSSVQINPKRKADMQMGFAKGFLKFIGGSGAWAIPEKIIQGNDDALEKDGLTGGISTLISARTSSSQSARRPSSVGGSHFSANDKPSTAPTASQTFSGSAAHPVMIHRSKRKPFGRTFRSANKPAPESVAILDAMRTLLQSAPSTETGFPECVPVGPRIPKALPQPNTSNPRRRRLTEAYDVREYDPDIWDENLLVSDTKPFPQRKPENEMTLADAVRDAAEDRSSSRHSGITSDNDYFDNGQMSPSNANAMLSREWLLKIPQPPQEINHHDLSSLSTNDKDHAWKSSPSALQERSRVIRMMRQDSTATIIGDAWKVGGPPMPENKTNIHNNQGKNGSPGLSSQFTASNLYLGSGHRPPHAGQGMIGSLLQANPDMDSNSFDLNDEKFFIGIDDERLTTVFKGDGYVITKYGIEALPEAVPSLPSAWWTTEELVLAQLRFNKPSHRHRRHNAKASDEPTDENMKELPALDDLELLSTCGINIEAPEFIVKLKGHILDPSRYSLPAPELDEEQQARKISSTAEPVHFRVRSFLLTKDAERQNFLHELTSSLLLRTRYVPRLAGAWLDGAIGWIGWEHSGQSLESIMQQRGPMPISVAGLVARQVLLALNAMHYLGRVHNDVSPRSIHINSKGEIRLANLHFCRATELGEGKVTPSATSFRGPWRYMSPERIVGLECSYSSDIWSLGITLLEALTGSFPYSPESMQDVGALKKTVMEKPAPINLLMSYGGASVDRDIRDFLNALLEKNPDSRPSARDALSSSGFIKRYWNTGQERVVSWMKGDDDGTVHQSLSP